MDIFTGCLTDKGSYRKKNQDAAVCHVKKSGKSVLAVACVCDGIGSFEQSEIAAEMVTDGITRWFFGVKELFPATVDGETLFEDLEITIRELNELVWMYSRDHVTEIGCTMSAMLIVNQSFYVFHVGDSRIYRVDETFIQITWDEVSAVELDGQVKRLLSNFIGKSQELWMNKVSGFVEPDSRFLLGTDGLFKLLAFDDVNQAVKRVKSSRMAQKACHRLLRLVMERGERDNISCILICVHTSKKL